jgi:hypothetical protein
MSHQRLCLLARGILLLLSLVVVLVFIYVCPLHTVLCEKGQTIRQGMTHDEVVAVLGPSPYPRGNWPTIAKCWLGYPERCEHWEDGANSVTVRFHPESGLVECKEIVFMSKPSPTRKLLERMKLLKPQPSYHYGGP